MQEVQHNATNIIHKRMLYVYRQMAWKKITVRKCKKLLNVVIPQATSLVQNTQILQTKHNTKVCNPVN